MKKLLFLLLTINCSLLTAEAQWVQVSNGIGNKTVYSLAYSGNNIFAGTGELYGVYLSTNNGTSWIQTSLNNRSVGSLVRQVPENYVFAGTEDYGVYLTTNNGTNWTQTSLNYSDVHSLTVNGNYLFAGSGTNGVFLSTNNGANWSQTPLNNRYVYSLAVSGNNIFAGTDSNGVYKSTNNGTSWGEYLPLYDKTILSFGVNGNTIFAGTDFDVYKSTNNGVNWTQTSLNNRTVWSLAVSGNNIFAGTSQNGVYVSNDNGASWIQRNEGLGNLSVYAFCILNNYIFAGTYFNSVYRRPLGELIGIQPISEQVPSHFALEQNYPNPFNPTTKIRFDLPQFPLNKGGLRGLFTRLEIYDILGREVSVLVNEQLKPGTYEVDFDGTDYPSGVYFCTLTAGEFRETKKMVLVK